jgi:hypothetical protein
MHASVAIGTHVVLLGGRGSKGVHDEFYAFDSGPSCALRRLNPPPATRTFAFLGKCPARCSHTAFLASSGGEEKKEGAVGDARLAFFGGTDGSGFYNDLLCFTPTLADVVGESKDERARRLDLTDKSGCCRTCGGPIGWSKLQDPGATDGGPVVVDNDSEESETPDAKFAHSLVSWRGGHLLFGGMNDESDFDSAFVLTLSDSK